jgi:hypothetical protein
VRKYWQPPLVAGLIGQTRSPWTTSSEAEVGVKWLWNGDVVFQKWQNFSIFSFSVFSSIFSYIYLISSLSLFLFSFFLLYSLRNPQILWKNQNPRQNSL